MSAHPDVSTALMTLANHIPSMVGTDAFVSVGLHLSDRETFDAIHAAYGIGAVIEHDGTDAHPSAFRTTQITINGVQATLFDSSESGIRRDHVRIAVHS